MNIENYVFGDREAKVEAGHNRGSFGYLNGNDQLVISTWDTEKNISCSETWDFRFDGIAMCIDFPDDSTEKLIAGPADILFDIFVGDSLTVSIADFEFGLKEHIFRFLGIKPRESDESWAKNS